MITENISKAKLVGKQIGVILGTFAPLHIGHQQLIYKALMNNDSALVVVCGSEKDRGAKIDLPIEKRFRYLREAYNDEPNLRVAMITEDVQVTDSQKNQIWSQQLLEILQENTHEAFQNIHFTFYVGEKEEVAKLSQTLPSNCEVKCENRGEINVSATEIRKHPMQYWDKINRVFRRHFTKKVLIAGSASTGKSTLVRRLARSINAPFSEEFARIYEERANITDEELKASDYANFILGQSEANYHEICSPSNNGITFFDTDVIVTQAYAQLYLPAEENRLLDDLFNLTIAREQFDLILVIPPMTEYIDDGFRNMDWAASRMEFHNKLMELYQLHGFKDKIVILVAQGETAQEGFYLRYQQAVNAIKGQLGIEIAHLN